MCVCVCLEFAAFNSRLYIKYDIATSLFLMLYVSTHSLLSSVNSNTPITFVDVKEYVMHLHMNIAVAQSSTYVHTHVLYPLHARGQINQLHGEETRLFAHCFS